MQLDPFPDKQVPSPNLRRTFSVVVLASGALLASTATGCLARPELAAGAASAVTMTTRVPFAVPAIDIDSGPEGDAVRRGRALADDARLAGANVGNALRCSSCHLDAGTVKNAGTWVGVVQRYPQYRARSGKVDTLPERINDCFERSMNGSALAEDDPRLRDLVAWMTFLSRDVPAGANVDGSGVPRISLARPAEPARGAAIYAARCAACHGAEGQGISDGSRAVFPPLWGEMSFNIGAGLARPTTMAGFVRHNMPRGQGGSLTDEEAFDVAAFVAMKPRPDHPAKSNDWPKGGKPADARD